MKKSIEIELSRIDVGTALREYCEREGLLPMDMMCDDFKTFDGVGEYCSKLRLVKATFVDVD